MRCARSSTLTSARSWSAAARAPAPAWAIAASDLRRPRSPRPATECGPPVPAGGPLSSARIAPLATGDTRALIGQAVERFYGEVPPLRQLKLVVRLELRARGDHAPGWRGAGPGPEGAEGAGG